MNLYRCARTRRSAKKVTRWSLTVEAHDSAGAANRALRILKPKAGQAIWVEFLGKAVVA